VLEVLEVDRHFREIAAQLVRRVRVVSQQPNKVAVLNLSSPFAFSWSFRVPLTHAMFEIRFIGTPVRLQHYLVLTALVLIDLHLTESRIVEVFDHLVLLLEVLQKSLALL
jgi:hypothetical protein